MPRGRKPLQTTPPVEPSLDTDRIEHAVEVMRELSVKSDEELAAVKQGLSDDRDLLNQLLGQAQMANALSQFSRTFSVQKLAFVKENKLYKALKGKITPNGSVLSGTWDEFCGLLGMSVDKADLDISNLKTFGEEALDSMSRMGIGYREMRQYRRLPEDQKAALLEAAKSGDKDSFLELAEDLIAKHAREKEEAQRQIEELKAEERAKEELLATKGKTIDELQTKVWKNENLPPDEKRKALLEAAGLARLFVSADIQGRLRIAFQELAEYERDNGGDSTLVMAGYIGELKRELKFLTDELMLPDVLGDGVPEWLKYSQENPVETDAQLGGLIAPEPDLPQ